MKATVWPENNFYFSYGLKELINSYDNKKLLPYPLVFIDISKQNIKKILSGDFFCYLSDGATVVFVCDEELFPLGVYLASVINGSFLFSKKSNFTFMLRVLSKLETNTYNTNKIGLNSEEFIVLKKVILRNETVKKIASDMNLSYKTIYSRCHSISKKIKIKNIKFLAI